jgi:hypothetical protein
MGAPLCIELKNSAISSDGDARSLAAGDTLRGDARHCRTRRSVIIAGAGAADDLGRLVVARIQQVEGIFRALACPVVGLWPPRRAVLTVH